MVFWRDCCLGHEGYQQIETDVTSHRPRLGVRHVQCFLVFCGLAVAYALRVNLSVAIVAMTDRNATNPDFEEFDWDENIKSYLLSSFFWGYVITQVPGGYLAHKYGAKYTFFCGVLFCSILSILTPACARLGSWRLVVSLRSLQGLCQGMIFPSTHTFLSKWAPAEERGRLVSYCYSGAQFGTVLILFVSGYIASSRFGWPGIFYISGVVGIVWALVWFWCSASTPAEHFSITAQERQFIEYSIQAPRNAPQSTQSSNSQPPRAPWSKIFTSVPFITLLLVHCGNNWGFWTLLTEIPTYMKSVLGVDIRRSGSLSALPYLVMCLLSYAFIFMADALNSRSVMPLYFSRKLFNTIGQWVPMFALIGLGYVTSGDHTKLAITLLTVAVGTNAATYLGFQVNHIDLSPNFAGTLMGITNCAANVISIIAPLTVGIIVTDEQNPALWRIVFFISAGFYFCGNLLFVVFGRTSIQPWNTPDDYSNNFHSDNLGEGSDAEDELLENFTNT